MATTIENRVTAQFVQKGDIGAIYGGVQIEGNVTVDEALKLGGLDWNVGIRPVLMDLSKQVVWTPDPKTGKDIKSLVSDEDAQDSDPSMVDVKEIEGFFATYRSDTNEPLGIVKSRYVPMQNRDAFSWLEGVLGKGEAFVETAGALHGGRITFVCIDLGGFEVVKGDIIRKHLLIVNSHDGTSNLVAYILPTRIACQNILNSLSQKNSAYKIRHTVGQKIALSEVQRVFATAKSGFTAVEETFKKFATTNISLETHREIIYRVLNVTEEDYLKYQNDEYAKQPQWVKEFQLIQLVADIPESGSEYASGTLWHTYNSITGYYDHVRFVRGSETKPDNAIESKIYGHSAREKSKAFDICLEYIK